MSSLVVYQMREKLPRPLKGILEISPNQDELHMFGPEHFLYQRFAFS